MPISQPNPRFSGYSSFGQGTPKTVTVLNSSTELLAENPQRQYVEINNNGSNAIWLGIGVDAVVGLGQRILPHTTRNFVDNELYLGQINAVSQSGTVNVFIIEGV